MVKQLPISPSRRTIETLFRELLSWYSDPSPAQELEEEYDKLFEEFESSPLIKRLKAKIESVRAAHKEKRDEFMRRVQAARERYLANGLTPAILKSVQKLVEEKNKQYRV